MAAVAKPVGASQQQGVGGPKMAISYLPWYPKGMERPLPLPVALIRTGEPIVPGDIKVYDILMLPKAYAEVVQVMAIMNGGTEAEEWDCLPLPFPAAAGGGIGALPWRLSVKALNGPADNTGEHRPIGVIRPGTEAVMTLHKVVVKNKDGQTEVVKVNHSAPVGMLDVGCPLNIPLVSLAPKIPLAAEPPSGKTVAVGAAEAVAVHVEGGDV